MDAITLSEAQFPQWDAFVSSHPNGTIYHGSEWKHGLEAAFSHIRGRFIAIIHPQEKAIVAGMPIYHVRSRLLGSRLVCVPFSTWCDPLYSDTGQLAVLLEKVRELAESTKSKSVEIRCRTTAGTPPPSSAYSLRRASIHHSIDLKIGVDEIWKSLPRTSIRQRIKKATKSGVLISSYSDESSLNEFYHCLFDTRKRLGLPMIPQVYFSSLHHSISKRSLRILLAREGTQTLGTALLLLENGICHLELIGERAGMKRPGTMHLLKWEAIRIACEEGCAEFSFGRTTFDNEGLLKYKRSWNAKEETIQTLSLNHQASGGGILSNSTLTATMRSINRKSPRRLYISLGSFIYRHWG